MDFDSRALSLDPEIPDHWEDQVKKSYGETCNLRAGMAAEFGERGIDAKIDNFVAMGGKPFSVLAHHNALFHQVRQPL